jgi:hypothetical protein
LKTQETPLHDAPLDESRALRPVPAEMIASEPSGSQVDRGEPATAAVDPVAAELNAVLAMRKAGADAKALRRALRRIEELLDE